ncbi:MAG: hypothetical protein V3V03_01675 [Hyphomonadaceae bacterium]
MGVKSLFKGSVLVGGLFMLGAGAALAQTCTETIFNSKPGAIYLAAENDLLQNNDAAAAMAKVRELRAMELNCYERSAITRLSASANIKLGNYAGAVADLQSVLDSGGLPQAEATKLYYSMGQLYLQSENLGKAREYFNKWIQQGGSPTRDDNWRLAVINEKLGDQRTAVGFAEKVLAADGVNAEREVYDFLIYLYDKTGDLGKQAALLETLLVRNPEDRRLWEVISGNYYKSGDERKAFEVQKAMYFAGILTTEDELMRIVNFYNRFDAPYQAASMLEKEMSAGRIPRSLERLELLANLYQVAREYERAIPVIRQAANEGGGGAMYERLGRSYAELKQWENCEEALTQALNGTGIKDRSLAWVLIGQSRFERDDRAGAREAFGKANSRGGRGWLGFMNAEDATAAALVRFDAQNLAQELRNEKKRCDQLKVLGGDNMPAGCATIDARLAEAEAEVVRLGG